MARGSANHHLYFTLLSALRKDRASGSFQAPQFQTQQEDGVNGWWGDRGRAGTFIGRECPYLGVGLPLQELSL